MGTSAGPYASLNIGALGLTAPLDEAMGLAAEHGYAAVDPDLRALRDAGPAGAARTTERLRGLGLRWGSAGCPVSLSGPAGQFAAQLAGLPAYAEVMAVAGIDRCGTWLRPATDDTPYRRMFASHAERIALVAEILGEHGVRLGLEYVGPKTSWAGGWFPFVHSLREARELIAAAGRPNVGLILDTYHWYCAGETVDDLAALGSGDVVAVDVNDAPAGVAREDQQDLVRELPGATGVIDVAGFIGALHAIGYDGPVKVEPFNKALAALPVPEAVAKAGAALRAVLGG